MQTFVNRRGAEGAENYLNISTQRRQGAKYAKIGTGIYRNGFSSELSIFTAISTIGRLQHKKPLRTPRLCGKKIFPLERHWFEV
jgi:hypothetical protein